MPAVGLGVSTPLSCAVTTGACVPNAVLWTKPGGAGRMGCGVVGGLMPLMSWNN